MNWFSLYQLIGKKIQNLRGRVKNIIKDIYKSPFSFLFFYLVLYAFHCIWNWSEFMSFNRNLELHAIHSGKQISLWSLYPFQIVSVLFVFVLYLFISLCINFLFSLGKNAKLIFKSKITIFFKSLVRQFFFFICILFMGNQLLGFFQDRNFYPVLVVLFWTSLFLLYIIQNGDLYKRIFVPNDHSITFLSHSLGYVNPILFVFFVLALTNV